MFRAEDLHRTHVGIFKRICYFYEVFLTALTSTEELFIEKPLWWLALFPVTCVNKFICIVVGFTIFHLSVAATGGVLLENVFFEISQNSQKNTCDKASFLIKLQLHAEGTASDLSHVLFLKISCLFHFNRKMKWKIGKYPDGVQMFTFLLEYRFFDVKDFKRNLTDDNLIRKCV